MVRIAARHAAIVVVIIHAGVGGIRPDCTRRPGTQYYLGEDRGDARPVRPFGDPRWCSVVLGSGPHVTAACKRYRGHLIAYSLGNFIGYRTLGQRGCAG